jgi:hypothetical protein
MMVCSKLRENGLPAPIGRTPDYGMMQRPSEILAWVEQNRPAAWVAVDDMPLDADPRMRGHFVRTNPLQGLTPQNASDAISILQQQMEPYNRQTSVQSPAQQAHAQASEAAARLPSFSFMGGGRF